MKNRIIEAQNTQITIASGEQDDYICITDMATAKSDKSRAADIIQSLKRSNLTTLKEKQGFQLSS